MFKVWKSASILVTLALVLSLGLVMAPMAGTAEAATIKVPDDYPTIQMAIDNADAGDTIIVAPGEYYEHIEIYEGLDGLTVKSSAGAEVTIIIGGGGPLADMAALNGGPVVTIYNVSGVTFQGFTVAAGTGSGMDPGYGIGMINASNCLIANNVVVENEIGIFVVGGTLYLGPVAGLEGLGVNGGMKLTSDGNTIRNNEVYDNGGSDMDMGYGILLINCNETTVKGNEIYDNEMGGVCVIGGFIILGVGETMPIPGIALVGAARDNQITDNEIYYHTYYSDSAGVILFNAIHNTVAGNEIYINYYGVFVFGYFGFTDGLLMMGEANENLVSDNEIYNNYLGVLLLREMDLAGTAGDLLGEAVGVIGDGGYVSDNDITDNTIEDNGHGVLIVGANNTRILRNDITENNAEIDSGIHIEYGSNGTEVHFNNIEGNSPPDSGSYGVWNHPGNPMLDAIFNWWGDKSGPYDPDDNGDTEVPPCTNDPATEKNANGQGDNVSSNVDYCPWLLERYPPQDSVSTTTGVGEASFSWSDPDSRILQLLDTEDAECSARPDIYFPFGIFSFKVLLKNPGGTVKITITLPMNAPIGTKYWKCLDGEWVDVTSLLSDNDGDNILILTLTDGGLGDDDGKKDGVIVDAGGPTIPTPAATGKKAEEPARFAASYLRVSPGQVNSNDPVEISINVANTGEESGSRAVTLYVNGEIEKSKMVSIPPGSTQNVKFTVTRATAGTYDVLLEGQEGQFQVRGASIFGGGGLGTGGIVVIIVVIIAIFAAVAFIMRGTPGGA